jgi:hypothetical protein
MCRFFCHFLPCYSNSSSQLKRLGLAKCRGISDGGLSGVAAKLPLLEELAISYCPLSKEALEAVGRSCPLLKSLQFNNWSVWDSELCHEEALAIAENMSELRRLNLVGTFTLTNDSLQAILDGCPHLESLDLRRCFNLTLAGIWEEDVLSRLKTCVFPMIPLMTMNLKSTFSKTFLVGLRT